MRFILFAALFAVAAHAQAATPDCRPLLYLDAKVPVAAPLALDQCEVDLKLLAEGQRARLRLELKATAAERWREALKPGGPWLQQVLTTQVSLRPNWPSLLPDGVLFSSESAIPPQVPTWHWNASDASLTLVPAGDPKPSVCARLPPGTPMMWFGTLELAPGSLLMADVATTTNPSSFTRVALTCIRGWGLSANAPAIIHPRFGAAQISSDAKDGTEFEVVAELVSGRVIGKVRVVRPEDHPLVGRWKQVAERLCEQTAMQPPRTPIREFVLTAKGEFSVTWQPFEVYKDYWGTYGFEKSTDTLTLKPVGSNFLPGNAGLTGKARLTGDGRLEVTGFVFGTRTGAQSCQVLFER